MSGNSEYEQLSNQGRRYQSNRRRFIQGLACLGGTILAGSPSCNKRKVRLQGVPPSKWVAPAELSSPVSNSTASRSTSREVRAELRVAYANLKIGNDVGGMDDVVLRSYNNAITGPILRVRPGDRLVVNVINDLPAVADKPGEGHGINITNLHSHGMHVSPLEGDNIFLEIGDGANDGISKTLTYNIPKDHPAGTFWYHPHKHGSVAVQVASGMAGALIVEGDIDELPEIKAAQERIFIFQQIPYNSQGRVDWDEAIGPGLPEHRYTTINGQLKPTIDMRPGEVQRWRFIHAGIKEKLSVSLQDHPLYVIAHDGLTTGRREEQAVIALYPGYREDVLVKASNTAGTYKLFDEKDANGLFDAETDQELAVVNVAGDPVDMSLPEPSQLQTLVHMPDLRSASLYRDRVRLRFDIAGGKYTICDKEYTNALPSLEMKVDGVDEWELITNRGVPKHHPFHIHVNPFQIIKVGTQEIGFPMWRDTVIVEKGQNVIIRMLCKDFRGESVLHCHILDHEDRGMMTKINIVDSMPTNFPC